MARPFAAPFYLKLIHGNQQSGDDARGEEKNAHNDGCAGQQFAGIFDAFVDI